MVEKSRNHFMEAELALAQSLCDLAETEVQLGEPGRANELAIKSNSATNAVRRCLRHGQLSAEDLERIENEIREVESRIQELKHATSDR